MSKLFKSLLYTRLHDILDEERSKKDIVFVWHDDNVARASALLKQHNILSLPIFKKNSCQLLGFVDIVDIVHFLCGPNPDLETRVTEISDLSWRDVLLVMDGDCRLTSLLDYFKQGIHRCLVNKKNSSPLTLTPSNAAICSQFDVIRFFYKKLLENDDKSSKDTVVKFGGSHDGVMNVVVCASLGDRVFDVMKLLRDNKVSAIAIVDDWNTEFQRKLVANFSGSDLRGFGGSGEDLIQELKEKTVGEYLMEHNPESLHPVSVLASGTSLEEVIRLLAESNCHRVWQVDDNGRPVGVISVTDVLQLINSS